MATERTESLSRQVEGRGVVVCQLQGAEPGKSWVAGTGASDVGNFRREVLET